MLIGARPRKLKNFEAAECPPPIARRPNSTVAAILRSTVIGSQSVKGCKGFKPIILLIWCHVHSASFIIFARVAGVLVSSVARVSSIARVSAGGSSNYLRTLRD